jgi:hypothetical protein
MTMRGVLPLFCVLALTAGMARAQGYERFNLFLDLNYASADRTLDLIEGRGGNTGSIVALRGSRIALATTSLIARRPLSSASLDSALLEVEFNQALGDDVFRLREARSGAAALRELLTEVRRRNFGQKVVGTVEQLFPPEARLAVRVPVFVVAFGHQNVDAFVRRVVWRGDEPSFVPEGQGELTIVVNLTKALRYGDTVDERFLGLLSVVAHEVFHAAFGAYKDDAPVWRAWYAAPRTALDGLLDLTQNEGIAYYLSLVQRTRGRLVRDWAEKSRAAVQEFNSRAEELLSPGVSPRRAAEIVQAANTSGYWESFGSITGMVMARQIDQTLGSRVLAETIASGPAEFFRKYLEAQRRASDAPMLSDRVAAYVLGLNR